MKMRAGMVPNESLDSCAAYISEDGHPFLKDMDSYYYARLTREFFENGHFGTPTFSNMDESNTDYTDMLRATPEGRPITSDLASGLPILTALLAKIGSPFGISLADMIYFMAAIISCLSLLAVYFLARRLTSPVGAICAAVSAVLSGYFYSRTFPGYYDTDMFIILFPALYFGLVLLATELKNKWACLTTHAAAALTILAYSYFWSAFTFFYAIVAATFCLGGVVAVIHKRSLLNAASAIFMPLVLFLLIRGDYVISGLRNLFHMEEGLSTAATAGGFPNLMNTVAELRPMPFFPMDLKTLLLGAATGDNTSVVEYLGGPYILVAAAFALMLITAELVWIITHPVTGKGESRSLLFPGILIIVWIVVAYYAMIQGTRFISLLALPVAILAGYMVDEIYHLLKKSFIPNNPKASATETADITHSPVSDSAVDIPAETSAQSELAASENAAQNIRSAHSSALLTAFPALLALIMGLLLAVPQWHSALLYEPGASAFDRAGVCKIDEEAMQMIREEMPEDTVIAAWWDDGYYYEYEGIRQTIFDGGYQRGALAYWFSTAMTATDDDLAAAILAMLANAGVKATDQACTMTGDTASGVALLKSILPLEAGQAKQVLVSDGYSDEDIEALLSMTHPAISRPVVLILSDDLFLYQITRYFTYFSSWSFSEDNGSVGDYDLPSADSLVARLGDKGT
ncbi:MAG: hypothetical protein KBS83_07700, partial [Lachnospiraceae bacterium]|nr:hypothetical protein [Candidatus Equihabitans merdae]